MDYPEDGNKKMQKIAIFAGVGFLFLLFIIFAVTSQLSRNTNSSATTTVTPTVAVNQGGSEFIGQQNTLTRQGSTDTKMYVNPTDIQKAREKAPVAGAAAKVGEEIIFNVDINRELSALPNSDDPTTIRTSFDKIVTDSVTLQGAAKAGYIKLDSTVYNSTTKDYEKRVALIDKAKRAIADNGDNYQGSFVQIWFHNQKPGKVGYTRGKQIAYEKIKPLYDDVKAGRKTMIEASDAILADESLYDVDEAYQVNSYGDFIGTPNNPPTFDSGFNTLLQKLKVGEVTPLYTAKDEDAKGNLIEAVYIFGKVDKIISNKGYTSYEEWLKINKPKYATVQY